MAFMKHIGKHGDRKVAVVYRTVPGEEHMALVIYPDTLSQAFHDSVMKVIEGPVGQDSAELADAMHRSLLTDGRPMLQTLHLEGKIKKVPTSQIVVTPNATSHVRLDELNEIVNGMEKGDEAAARMKELDDHAGLVAPHEKQKVNEGLEEVEDVQAPAVEEAGVLDDEQLGMQMYQQSQQMADEAQSLIEESKRLEKEAFDLNPALKPKRGRGRPKKAEA